MEINVVIDSVAEGTTAQPLCKMFGPGRLCHDFASYTTLQVIRVSLSDHDLFLLVQF